jgi:hypothetical protein
MKGFLYTLVTVVFLAVITVLVYNHAEAPIETHPSDAVSTSTQLTTIPVSSDRHFNMELYQTARVEGVTINVSAVTEDSRCPANANCFWAGRVKIAVSVSGGTSTSTREIEIGESVTIENKKITLKEVLPQKILDHKIADDEYVFNFMIEDYKAVIAPTPKPIVMPQPQPSTPGMASTCEYTERYACYKTAKCEVQTSGECGWTQTSELTQCINNAR